MLILCFSSAAYSDPNFYYEFTARYHAAPCNSIYNTSFEKKLLQILTKLVVELSCEVALRKSECHHVKMQRAGMQNEIFFTFTGKICCLLKNCLNKKCCDTCIKKVLLPSARYKERHYLYKCCLKSVYNK